MRFLLGFLHNKGCFESNFGHFSKAGQFQFAVFKTNPVPVGTFQNRSSSSLRKGNRSSNSPGARSKKLVAVDRKAKWSNGLRKCSEGKTVKFQGTHWRKYGVGPELCADGIVRNVRHPGICTCSCLTPTYTDLQIYRFTDSLGA